MVRAGLTKSCDPHGPPPCPKGAVAEVTRSARVPGDLPVNWLGASACCAAGSSQESCWHVRHHKTYRRGACTLGSLRAIASAGPTRAAHIAHVIALGRNIRHWSGACWRRRPARSRGRSSATKLSGATTRLRRRARDRRIGTKDAALALNGLHAVATAFAIIDDLTGVRRHGLDCLMPARGARDDSLQFHCLPGGRPPR